MMRAELQIEEEQRRAERLDIMLPVDVRFSGPRRFRATVLDLSVTGFRVQSDEHLRVGTMVWVKIGALGPLMAHVKWSNRLMAGCAFDAPLHKSVMEHLVRVA